MQRDRAVAAPRHLLHDGVAVLVAGGQRQQDLEPDGSEREEAFGTEAIGHSCVASIRATRIDDHRPEKVRRVRG